MKHANPILDIQLFPFYPLERNVKQWLALSLFVFSFSGFASFIEKGSLPHHHWINGKKPFPDSLQSRDFFVTDDSSLAVAEKARSNEKETGTDHQSCREHIAKVICLVDPSDPNDPNGPMNDDRRPRPCLPGGEAYAHHFEKLFDVYPPFMQKMFCSLRSIFIEKKFIGTAYAGTLTDKKGKIDGAIMGIRQSVLDEDLDLKTWSSWKEQLSFGGVTGDYHLKNHLPQIQTSSLAGVNDFLYFVIAHEFGHIFDFANKINTTTHCRPKPKAENPPPSEPQPELQEKECVMHPQSFGAISWETDFTPWPQNNFTHFKNLCFYWCEGRPINVDYVPQVYSDFFLKGDFISLYATSQPWDDFAESLAYYLYHKYLKGKYKINTAQGVTYDITHKLKTVGFAKKYLYLRKFEARPDIIYP